MRKRGAFVAMRLGPKPIGIQGRTAPYTCISGNRTQSRLRDLSTGRR